MRQTKPLVAVRVRVAPDHVAAGAARAARLTPHHRLTASLSAAPRPARLFADAPLHPAAPAPPRRGRGQFVPGLPPSRGILASRRRPYDWSTAAPRCSGAPRYCFHPALYVAVFGGVPAPDQRSRCPRRQTRRREGVPAPRAASPLSAWRLLPAATRAQPRHESPPRRTSARRVRFRFECRRRRRFHRHAQLRRVTRLTSVSSLCMQPYFNTLYYSLSQGSNTPFTRPPIVIDNCQLWFTPHRPTRPRSPDAPTRRGRWPSPRRPPVSSPTPLSASTPDGPTLGALRAPGRLAGGRPG